MPAYWIAHVTVTDPDAYKDYQALAPSAFAAHGAKFLARGPGDVLEGPEMARHVVIEFPTLEAAQACYESKEYKAAVQHLSRAGMADLVIIGGYDGPQPGGTKP